MNLQEWQKEAEEKFFFAYFLNIKGAEFFKFSADERKWIIKKFIEKKQNDE